MHTVFLEPVFHRGENRIKLITPYRNNFFTLCKQFPECNYSSSMKCWHLPMNKTSIKSFIEQANKLFVFKRYSTHDKLLHPHQATKRTIYSKKDVLLIAQNLPDDHYKLMLYLAYGIGLKGAELVRIKVKHFCNKNKTLTIYNRTGAINRVINVNVKLWLVIQRYLLDYQSSESLFDDSISVNSFYKVLGKACRKIKLTNTGIQSLRYSFAHNLLNEGQSIDNIRKALGHKQKLTTVKFLNQ